MTSKQSATMPQIGVARAKNLGGEKEEIYHIAAIGKIDGKMLEIVDVRCYRSRSGDGSRPVYCSVWIRGRNFYTSGHGKADGYGYCKKSASMSEALASAGVILGEDIAGRGERAMANAAQAICDALEAADVFIIAR